MNQSNQRVINNKLGLLNLADELSNISRACRVMGVSRDTFYRYREAVEDGSVEALLDKNRRKPNIKNGVDKAAERAVCDWAIAYHPQTNGICDALPQDHPAGVLPGDVPQEGLHLGGRITDRF